MNDAHRAGKFQHFGISNFGISNFAPDEVERVVSLCKRSGWVAPTVYQGHYNAVSRLAEEELLPVLPRLGLRFYAYSPGAGAMFSGTATAEDITKKQGGRWKHEVSTLTQYTLALALAAESL